ncbi:MAG: hypothetical protein Pg6A_01910 [Termitinemataceae bacterium]|nr:MAG: hypothetical protein Pg6A_01910 [Termitinemataceae bacterium]
MAGSYKQVENYDVRFGVSQETDDETARKKRERALERAWQTRDFEIDKFWNRTAFFWGFIAVVFGAFAAVITKTVDVSDSIPYIELYLILLGGIVSVAWLLVVKGSKFWQENWEAHIDRLEDSITGPLYKTVYTKGKNAFSVSRINIILAVVVIVVWGLLLVNFFLHCDIVQTLLKVISPYFGQIVGIFLPIILTVICIYKMFKYGRSANGKYRIDKRKDHEGIFVDRSEEHDKE